MAGPWVESASLVARVRAWWRQWGMHLLHAANAVMAVVGAMWLAYQFWRLVWAVSPIWPTSPRGAIDLEWRYLEVKQWFAGAPVYDTLWHAVYPPASYAILWPLLGWLSLDQARVWWAATTLAALAWLIHLIIRESGPRTRAERAFVTLMPLAMYATGAAVGNGQLVVHLLPALLTGLLWSQRERASQYRLAAAALLVLSLAKPSIALPFLWIVLFCSGGLGLMLLISAGYLALTFLAAFLQPGNVVQLLGDWMAGSLAALSQEGVPTLHTLLEALGLGHLRMLGSALLLAGLGLWTYRHRRASPWLLMSVAALVSRFWTYHQWYDDLILLVPMVSLFQIAHRGPHADGRDVTAAILLAFSMLLSLAPGGRYLFPAPWDGLYAAGQLVVWGAVAFFLLGQARRERAVGGQRTRPAPHG
jgi:hypothetical protein